MAGTPGKEIVTADKNGRIWRMMRPDDLEAIWNSMDCDSFDEDAIPYWVELWPASLILVEWLYKQKRQIAGRNCLDLGCGLGLTAMLGQYLGAHVLAVDHTIEAANYCRHNSRLNAIPDLAVAVMDWGSPATRAGLFKYVWAADIIYERRFFQPVLGCLDYLLEPDGVAWIAEPGRAIFREFLEKASECGWQSSIGWKNPEQAGALWQLQKKIDVHSHEESTTK